MIGQSHSPAEASASTGDSANAGRDTQQQIDQLKQQVDALTAKSVASDSQINDLRATTDSLAQSSATLNIGGSDYAPIKTSLGTMLISWTNAEPYQDGCRLTFRIGNPTTAKFAGGVLDIEHGPTQPAGATLQQWQQTLHRDTLQFTDTLEPGTWTVVSVMLPATTLNELRFVKVTMALNGLSLRAPVGGGQ